MTYEESKSHHTVNKEMQVTDIQMHRYTHTHEPTTICLRRMHNSNVGRFASVD